MKSTMKKNVLIANDSSVSSVFQTAGCAPSTTPGAVTRISSNVKNGMSQPPRKSVAMSADAGTMLEYSAMKNMENFIEGYSVSYPVTMSDSASAMSNGSRFVWANDANTNMHEGSPHSN